MKKILAEILLILGVFLPACTVTKYVPVETIKEVHIKDTTWLRDTLIDYRIEREYIRDWTGLLDTLRMGTEYSDFKAYADTSKGLLVGEARNKDKVIPVPAQIPVHETVRDSIVYKEVPVPVEVVKKVTPRWAWWSLIASIVMAAGIILFIFSPLASYFTKRG